MLRLYKPIDHEIFKLHELFSHVIKEVWCKACDDACEDKLQNDFKKIYTYSYKSTKKVKKTLKDEVERIYEIFRGLSHDDKKAISDAFDINNQIENLCEGNTPVYLKDLPRVVENDIKPLMFWCYETLLDKGKVAGDKMDYYTKLIEENDFDYCPCCGFVPFEDPESICREAYDHYLPKSEYPFASINFKNLVPLCYKCNSDRKKAKDPIENDRVTYFPFSKKDHSVSVKTQMSMDIDNDTKQLNYKDLSISFTGDSKKNKTWDWMFDMNDRYIAILKKRIPRWSRELANRYRRDRKKGKSIVDIINEHLDDYDPDKFSELKFLKIAFLISVKNDKAFLNVYDKCS